MKTASDITLLEQIGELIGFDVIDNYIRYSGIEAFLVTGPKGENIFLYNGSDNSDFYLSIQDLKCIKELGIQKTVAISMRILFDSDCMDCDPCIIDEMTIIDVDEEDFKDISDSTMKLINEKRQEIDLTGFMGQNRLLSLITDQLRKDKLIPKGYSIVDGGCRSYTFHKSANIVFRMYTEYYLMGQDENSYFCCLLPRKVTSIKDAYEALKPEEIKGRKNVFRQGEWFIVPCNKKEAPPIPQDDDPKISLLSLPRRYASSNLHVLSADDIWIDPDGYIYAYNGMLEHCIGPGNEVMPWSKVPSQLEESAEHEDVEWKGWCWLVENRAVESWSDHGMD